VERLVFVKGNKVHLPSGERPQRDSFGLDIEKAYDETLNASYLLLFLPRHGEQSSTPDPDLYSSIIQFVLGGPPLMPPLAVPNLRVNLGQRVSTIQGQLIEPVCNPLSPFLSYLLASSSIASTQKSKLGLPRVTPIAMPGTTFS